jgi:hypothetical protein
MKFPTIVYRCPGVHQRPGGTYDFLGVKNQGELESALKAGWAATLPEAMGQPATIATALTQFKNELEVLGDDAPPTRAELEKQATELGVKFNKKTTDAELDAKINEALEG